MGCLGHLSELVFFFFGGGGADDGGWLLAKYESFRPVNSWIPGGCRLLLKKMLWDSEHRSS